MWEAMEDDAKPSPRRRLRAFEADVAFGGRVFQPPLDDEPRSRSGSRLHGSGPSTFALAPRDGAGPAVSGCLPVGRVVPLTTTSHRADRRRRCFTARCGGAWAAAPRSRRPALVLGTIGVWRPSALLHRVLDQLR